MNQEQKKKTKKSWFKGPLWDLTGPEIFILDNYLLNIYVRWPGIGNIEVNGLDSTAYIM